MILYILLIVSVLGYEYTCSTEIEDSKDTDLQAIEVTTVNSCVTQHGKIVVRNLNGAVTEVSISDKVYPISSTSNNHEISVLSGFYTMKVIKRSEGTCRYRLFKVTVKKVDECEPFYTATVKEKKIIWQVDNTTTA
ncbi:hypothetical protein EIN_034560 [Entamoeba invadens IP1]|uniref:Uncharacterized protein n=1 Tax=Entamoeba invadens IP1 TaxID=370355 RepID=A0A0A1TYF1_ENTIV|nr:hypothetical protein EIN_034560 [Entamoeba invadens IP1]ELP86515.1 hypothetical protein EIN_034560 [Entamoeba invadens IP1]|eukprot:XP_004185861.1 hypothetical protein EIN_034560 [Entamoeba invadens IP1]